MPGSKPPIRVAILTVSDASAQGLRADRSGPELASRCQELGWSVTASAIVPDEPDTIADQLQRWVAGAPADVILTTGGTGITERDITPEATRRILSRELPGVAELMRQSGLEQTPLAVLSRGLVGTAGHTLVANLPGSPAGAVFSLNAIQHLVPHIVQLLHGDTTHG